MSKSPNILLLNLPTLDHKFVRRGFLREKRNNIGAYFPSSDMILFSGFLYGAGYTVQYLDADIEGYSISDVARYIQKNRVGMVISLLSFANQHQDLKILEALSQTIPGVRYFVLTNIAFILEPERVKFLLSERRFLEGAILNPIESEFLPYLKEGAGTSSTYKNFAYRNGDQMILGNVFAGVGKGLKIPLPRHDLFKNEHYRVPQSKRNPMTCTQFSFGCPHRCTYCIDNALYNKYLLRDVDNMIEEMRYIESLGIREIYFTDLTFGMVRDATRAFCEALIKEKIKLNWLCTSRVDVFDEETLDWMARAGCYGMEFGVEHVNEGLRKAYNKRQTNQDIVRTFKACQKAGIETTAFLMIGFPEETEKDVWDNVNFAIDLGCDYISYNVLSVLPNTPMEQRFIQEGLIDSNNVERFKDTFFSSHLSRTHLSAERIAELQLLAYKKFYLRPAYLYRRLERVRSFFELKKLFRLGYDAVRSDFVTPAVVTNGSSSQ